MRTMGSLVLCFLFTASVAVGWAEDIITLKRSGVIFNSRSANIALVVRIERHDDNRGLEISCESAEFYTSSSETLHGKDSPVETRFELNLYKSQEYECRAILIRNTQGKKREFTAVTKFPIF